MEAPFACAPDRGGPDGAARSYAPSVVASLFVHGAILAVVVAGLRPAVSPVQVFPVALVDGWGDGGGGGAAGAAGDAPPRGPEPAPESANVPAPAPTPMPARVARPRTTPAASTARSASTAPAGGEGTGSGTAPAGDGSGSGGGGGGGIGVAYAANPLPPYPLVARRLGMQGTVELDVLVGTDGHAAEVRVRRSSGFAPLDAAALATVRERWRFVAARRGEVAVESRVTIPIVFRLDGVETGEPRG